ncbi:MAG TPA: NUDIX domain-containing protein [Methylomirabilota bacterium]
MKQSAGILLFRDRAGRLEVLLVHPGGPFWAKKDAGAWTIPKGAIEEGEEPLAAARREFEEETGTRPVGEALPLSPRRQPGGKLVLAWAVRGDLDATAVTSTSFTMEWPPRSGRQQEFPEVDRAGWFALDEARVKILKGQAPFLDDLQRLVGRPAR